MILTHAQLKRENAFQGDLQAVIKTSLYPSPIFQYYSEKCGKCRNKIMELSLESGRDEDTSFYNIWEKIEEVGKDKKCTSKELLKTELRIPILS